MDTPTSRMEGVIEGKNAVMSHFESFFKESSISRPMTDEIYFKCLYEEESNSLEEYFPDGILMRHFGVVMVVRVSVQMDLFLSF